MRSSAVNPWIGIDWGSTHRRAWCYERGVLSGHAADDQGLIACAPNFAPALATLLVGFGVTGRAPTVVMSGMVGSIGGWQPAGYLDAATPLSELPRRLERVERPGAPADAWIVPGVRWRGAGDQVDVMRGEETQLYGALRLLGDASDGWYVLPGTHSKWVLLRAGAVQWMRTYLTGELYGLLRERGTLADLIRAGEGSSTDRGTATPARGPEDAYAEARAAAFARGAALAGAGALSHALFGARARVVVGDLPRADAAAFISGALIGTEWRDIEQMAAGAGTPAGAPEKSAESAAKSALSGDLPIRIIGSPQLAPHYVQCGRLRGLAVDAMDVDAIQQAAWDGLRAETR